MRITDIIRDANNNLLRSKARSLLTIIAIFIGAMTLTITNGIGSGVSSYIDKELGNLGAEDVIIVQPKVESQFGSGPKKYDESKPVSASPTGGGFSLPMLRDNDLKQISDVSGVISAEPYLSASPQYVSGPNGEKYQMTVSGYIGGTQLQLSSGSLPDNGSADKQVLLPLEYVSVLGFESPQNAVGKQVTIGIDDALGLPHEVTAQIVGVQEKSLMSVGGASINDALMRNLVALQSEGRPVNNNTDGYMAVVARVEKTTSASDMEHIKSVLREKGYDAQTFQDSIGVFKQVINAIIMVLNFFAILALVAASFGIVNTLLMAVQERTKEIGLMKAMGLGKGKIFLLFSIEAILLGFWGSLLGSLAGIGIGQIANRFASESFLKDLPGFDLTSFSVLSVVVIMGIIMIIAFIAGTIPARRASQKDPIDSLRYE